MRYLNKLKFNEIMYEHLYVHVYVNVRTTNLKHLLHVI
jgi:hypothetical protein